MGGFSLSEIEDRWIEERTSVGPADQPEEFYESVAAYVAELEREIEESEDLRQDLLLMELDHILQMVQDIHLLRILKIMDQLLEGEKEKLLDVERDAFQKFQSALEDLKDELLGPILRGESELRPPRERSNVLLFLISDISEKIICSDMRYYGPFRNGDVVNIPERSADLIVDQGLAKNIRIKEA